MESTQTPTRKQSTTLWLLPSTLASLELWRAEGGGSFGDLVDALVKRESNRRKRTEKRRAAVGQ